MHTGDKTAFPYFYFSCYSVHSTLFSDDPLFALGFHASAVSPSTHPVGRCHRESNSIKLHWKLQLMHNNERKLKNSVAKPKLRCCVSLNCAGSTFLPGALCALYTITHTLYSTVFLCLTWTATYLLWKRGEKLVVHVFAIAAAPTGFSLYLVAYLTNLLRDNYNFNMLTANVNVLVSVLTLCLHTYIDWLKLIKHAIERHASKQMSPNEHTKRRTFVSKAKQWWDALRRPERGQWKS